MPKNNAKRWGPPDHGIFLKDLEPGTNIWVLEGRWLTRYQSGGSYNGYWYLGKFGEWNRITGSTNWISGEGIITEEAALKWLKERGLPLPDETNRTVGDVIHGGK